MKNTFIYILNIFTYTHAHAHIATVHYCQYVTVAFSIEIVVKRILFVLKTEELNAS